MLIKHLLLFLAAITLMAYLDQCACAGQPEGTEFNVGNWQVECFDHSCLVVLLNSGAGDNSVFVKLSGVTKKPVHFGFLASGDINQQEPLTVGFARTVLDSSRSECRDNPEGSKPVDCFVVEPLPKSSFNHEFLQCMQQRCIVRIEGDSVRSIDGTSDVDLLSQFRTDDFVLLVYKDKKENLQKRMLNIYGFDAAYDAALKKLQSL